MYADTNILSSAIDKVSTFVHIIGMAKKLNPVKEAVSMAGGPTRVANLCGISSATVHNWIKARRVKDLIHAMKLAEASGVELKELAGE